jgi:hypothetical protein
MRAEPSETVMFERHSWKDLGPEFQDALEWLRQLRVRYEPGRFVTYEKAIDEVSTKGWWQVPAEDRVATVTALYETHDLIYVRKAFANSVPHDSIRKRLQDFVKGPNSYADERSDSNSNRPRNFGFELIVLATLANAGLKLNFDTDSDAAAHVEDSVLLFQGKRPQSALGTGLERNFERACEQLERKYENDEGGRYRGLVAVDVTKVLNKNFELADFNHNDHLLATFRMNSKPHPNTIGVLLRFSAIVQVTSDIAYPVRWVQTCPLIERNGISPENARLCRTLHKHLSTLERV